MNEQKKEIKNDEPEKQQTENTELSDETLEEVNGGLGLSVVFCKGCGKRRGRIRKGYCDECYTKRFGDGSGNPV